MSKGLEEDVRKTLRGPTYIFFAAFSVGTLGVLFGDNIVSGAVLNYVIRGSLLISMISGFYIGIVSAWNYTSVFRD